MSAAHATRGKVTERMTVAWLRPNGFPLAERVVRTGYRAGSRTSADGGDIAVCLGVIAQVKALQPVSRAERAVAEWMTQTEAQRVASGANVGLLIVRRPGTADVGEWWAYLSTRTVVSLSMVTSLPWQLPDSPDAPVRLLLADAARLLRWAGYGDQGGSP